MPLLTVKGDIDSVWIKGICSEDYLPPKGSEDREYVDDLRAVLGRVAARLNSAT
jgi:hypothetical protein